MAAAYDDQDARALSEDRAGYIAETCPEERVAIAGVENDRLRH